MWSSAWEELLFKHAPEGWTFNSSYPRIFSRRRWTYLLTDVEKERLAERLRRGLRTLRHATFGVCLSLGVSLAFWFPDLLRQWVAGSPGAWALFFLIVLVLTGVLLPIIGIAHYHLVQPVLRAARRIGPAPHHRISVIRLLADMSSSAGPIVRSVLALLGCGLGAYLSLYSSRRLKWPDIARPARRACGGRHHRICSRHSVDVLAMRLRLSDAATSAALAEHYRMQAAMCHQMAQITVSPFKEGWLELAAVWTTLAREQEEKAKQR